MKEKYSLAIIILAAGKGTRMKSSLAKVLHPVFEKSMVEHVLQATSCLPSNNRIVIIGHQAEQVQSNLAKNDCSFILQKEQLGTAHAVLVAQNGVKDECEDVMILCGDTPLLSAETLEEMYADYKQSKAILSLMTTKLHNPSNYGRIISDENGQLQAIVEEKDASPDQRKINEINAGIYIVNKEFLYDTLSKIDSNNSQGEFYLTDIVKLASVARLVRKKYINPEAKEVLGVNSRIELAEAETELRFRHNKKIMLQGVSMINANDCYISPASEVGMDCLIGKGAELRGNCLIGANCQIDTGAILENCQIPADSYIGPYSYLKNFTPTEKCTLVAYSQN
ncbi:MAG: sugar phosphate nucleotidyltransferase [Desulfotalea sp.]